MNVTEPILAFRSWYLQREPHAPPFVDGRRARGYFKPTQVDDWLATHVDKPRPSKPRKLQPVGTLRSLNQSVWTGRAAHFRCQHGHEVPVQGCGCGLYAVLTLAEVEDWGGHIRGAVICWGRVIIHGTEGLRAEYMRIVALARTGNTKTKVKDPDGVAARAAARLYGVPLVDVANLELVGREHGKPVTWEYRFQ